jgi:3-oxoacyl-[acyl-carrier protein] reductase
VDTLGGKVALVTGGSRGIGRAMAIALARTGAKVAVNYKTHAADAEAVCAQIGSLGGQAIAIQADVSISNQVDEMVQQVER